MCFIRSQTSLFYVVCLEKGRGKVYTIYQTWGVYSSETWIERKDVSKKLTGVILL